MQLRDKSFHGIDGRSLQLNLALILILVFNMREDCADALNIPGRWSDASLVNETKKRQDGGGFLLCCQHGISR